LPQPTQVQAQRAADGGVGRARGGRHPAKRGAGPRNRQDRDLFGR
jgi:hypothetical protein